MESTNIYSHARNVASNLIQIDQEVEKFIFYRGLGEIKTKLKTTSHEGNLRIENTGVEEIPAVFLIYTDGKDFGDLISLKALAPNRSIEVGSADIHKLTSSNRSHSDFLKRAHKHLQSSLVNAGLFNDEAQAMIDTWSNGYFNTPGLRILYVLSKQEVSEILPVRVSPMPDELNRVFIGRIEILLDTTEQQILLQILKESTQYDVSVLGTMALPTLLRIRDVAEKQGLLSPELSAVFATLIGRIP